MMNNRKVMKLASRGKRFGAACIDMVIPAVSCFIASGAAIAAIVSELAYGNYGYGFGAPGFGYGYGYISGPSAGVVTALIISMLLSVAYVVIQLVFYNKSKSIGKAALGLQVVSSKDGTPVGFWKMLFREWFVKSASGSVFVLGFIWILIDDRNRGWHDKILDTYVVDLKESEALNASSEQDAYREPAPSPVPEPVPERPAPKSAPIPAAAPVMEPAEQESEAAAEAADMTEYDTVNARTDDIDEQE